MMNISSLLRTIAACATLFQAAACSSAGAERTLTPESTLPLPEAPAGLSDTARATYQIARFWDAMDFADTTLTRNSDFMGRNLRLFASLYGKAESDSLSAVTARFLAKATTDLQARILLYDLICDSIPTDAPAKLPMLQEWVKLPLDSYELEEPRYRLNAYLKNRPGTVAADFNFTTADGRQSSLHATKGERTLLIFYDPDCDHCTATIAQLSADERISRLREEGKLTVLADYTESDPDLWRSNAPDMPSGWIVATDSGSVLDGELYDIPEMPGIYLLDASKRVILRNPSAEQLLQTLSHN